MGETVHKLLAAVSKEIRVILRDKEALLILFVMPVVFVLIMSLALQDAFSERAGVRFSVLIVDHDRDMVGDKLDGIFATHSAFRVTSLRRDRDTLPGEDEIREDLRSGRYRFAVIIPAGATAAANRRLDRQLGLDTKKSPAAAVDVRLLSDPTVRRDHRSLVITALNQSLQGIEAGMLLARLAETGKRIRAMAGNAPGAPAIRVPETLGTFVSVTDEYDTGKDGGAPVPTSVQQNAPAWTLLAMFFLVIPLSVTLIKERQQGSLLRLRSMAVPPWILLAGKALPYFIINQIQVVLILLVGMHLLPRLGGDALQIGNAPGGIVLLSMAASLAAIGYGLLVATFARTPEQATTFGATSVLILAALGGVMVPKLVMPPLLQKLANVSPMSWGLEGFLDIFVRSGNVREVLPEFLQLTGFAAVCLIIATLRFGHSLRHN
jgi:ABC-2 type transport system permease protein